MNKSIFLLLILFVVGFSCQSLLANWNFSANETSATGEFRARITKGKLIGDVQNVVGGILKSVLKPVVGRNLLDGIRFAGFAMNPTFLGLGGIAPTASMAYFSSELDLNANLNNGFNFDVSACLNFITMKLFGLEEVNVEGNIVKSINFNTAVWAVVSTNIGSTEIEIEVPYITLGASINGINVQITFIVSSTYGTINLSGLPNGSIISPKGIEVIFSADLSNYVYLNANNILRLVTYVVTGPASIEADIQSALSADFSLISSVVNGISANVRFEESATISGSQILKITPVISLSSSLGVAFNNIDSLFQINSALGLSVQLNRIDIGFSAGFKGVVSYNPTLTFGNDPANSKHVESK